VLDSLFLNSSPNDITLSSNTINENAVTGTSIGMFTASDPDAGDSHIFTLVSGTGDTDNSNFTITGTS